MSGFHPVLGLLAVAVCTSFAKGAALPSILNNDGTAYRLHEANSGSRQLPLSHNNEVSKGLYKDIKRMSLSENEYRPDTHVNDGTNTANSDATSGFEQVKNLRRAADEDFHVDAKNKDSASGGLDDQSGETSGLVNNEPSQSEQSDSSSEEDSETASGGGHSGSASLASAVSNSEEKCDENVENESSQSSSTATTSSSTSTQSVAHETQTKPTDGNDEPDPEDCEETEFPTEKTEPPYEETEPPSEAPEHPNVSSSSSESSNDDQQSESQESECEETTEGNSPTTSPTSSTRTTRRPTTSKKPRDHEGSSGSFGDTDEEGVVFSDSESEESKEGSTNLSWGG